MRSALCAALAISICSPAFAAMEMFSPDATWIRAGFPDVVQETADPTRVNADDFGMATENRILIRDDSIFPTIPMGSTIDSAILTLYLNNGSANTLNVHQVTESWSESTVTWNNFSATPGGAAGVDYLSTPAVSFIPGPHGSDSSNPVSNDIDITSVVQSWSDNGMNEGIILISSGGDGVTYRSDDASAFTPKLTVNYSTAAIPEPSSFALFGLVACGYGLRKRYLKRQAS